MVRIGPMLKATTRRGTQIYNGRQLIKGFVRSNSSLPSSPEMKSQDSWTENKNDDNNNTVINKVMGIARNLQETTQPPVNVSPSFSKRFNNGDMYDPFDFSNDKLDIERRLRRQEVPYHKKKDPFDRTGIDPLDLYTMPEILSKFITSTGQILPREITGCSARNQKKLSTAIKRSRACGLLSTVHKHHRYLPTRNM